MFLINKAIRMPLWKSYLLSLLTIYIVNLLCYVSAALIGFSDSYRDHLLNLSHSYSVSTFVLTSLLMPVLEELTFRLLLSGKKNHVTISFALIYSFFFNLLLLASFIEEIDFHPYLIFFSVGIFVFAKAYVLMTIPIRLGKSFSDRMTETVNQNFQLICYSSATAFALVHLIFQKIFFSVSFLTLIPLFFSYFFYGLVFNYIRIQYGIIYSIIFHIFLNSIAYIKFFL